MRENSVAKAVRDKVERGAADKLWTYADFDGMSTLAVAAALSRLAKEGLIRRVRNGVYYKPRETRFGPTRPDAARVAEAVLGRRGIRWSSSGLPAYNALGLTTQVSAVPTFDVDREVTSLRTNPLRGVRLRTVDSLRGLKPEERSALDALRDLKSIPDTTPDEALKRVAELCRSGRVSFDRMAKHSGGEPPRVKALLGTVGTMIGRGDEE